LFYLLVYRTAIFFIFFVVKGSLVCNQHDDVIMKLDMNGKIGLVVRGKTGLGHSPGVMAQHADCILGSGEPLGFYGDANGGRSNGIGMNMTGAVFRYDKLYNSQRRSYVDLETAKTDNLVSGVLLIPATGAQVQKFTEYWDKLERKPGEFEILGDNCSTHASAGFIYCGIIKNGIPGLDTPDNLFRQLHPLAASQAFFGYFGFTRNNTVFDVEFEALGASKAVKTGSSAVPKTSQSQFSGLPSSLNSSNTGSRVSTHPSTSRR
jgi:hypothetical protein